MAEGIARMRANWERQFRRIADEKGSLEDWHKYLYSAKKGSRMQDLRDHLAPGLRPKYAVKKTDKSRDTLAKVLRQLATDLGLSAEFLDQPPVAGKYVSPGRVIPEAQLRQMLSEKGLKKHYPSAARAAEAEPEPLLEEVLPPEIPESTRGLERAGPAAVEEETKGPTLPLSRGDLAFDVRQLLPLLEGARPRNEAEHRNLQRLRVNAFEIANRVKLDASLPKSFGARLQELAINQFAPPSGKYEYIGAETDLLENVAEGTRPLNELDAAGQIHDTTYLRIAADFARGEIGADEVVGRVRSADEALSSAADRIADRSSSSNDKRAAGLVSAAMKAKAFGSAVLPTWLGVATPLRKNELRERVRALHTELTELLRNSESVREETRDRATSLAHEIRAGLEASRMLEEGAGEAGPVEEEEPETKEPATGAEVSPAGAAGAAGAAATAVPVATGAAAAAVPVATGAAAAAVPAPTGESTRAEGRYSSIGVQGAVEMIGNKIADFAPVPERMLLPEPITGERIASLFVPIGDDGSLVALTTQEREETDTFFSRFKNVSRGMGNGNQQLLPWEIGQKTNNCLIDAVARNERLRDEGALYWGKVSKPVILKLSREQRMQFRIPMYTDSACASAWTRDTPAEAAAGRQIQMSTEQMPTRLLTPKQWINSVEQRLVRPSITEGLRN